MNITFVVDDDDDDDDDWQHYEQFSGRRCV